MPAVSTNRYRDASNSNEKTRPGPPMTARIFKPAKNAMQSGRSKTKEWQLDYEPEQPRSVEPLMGWTSSGDMKQQITLHFQSKEEAVAYCERKGIAYQVIEPQDSIRRPVAYSDNFSFRRGEPWTH
jgi:hypothetical protein